jgi:nicotinamidase/pyrazinamidase
MTALRLDLESDILGLIDVQPTFMPGGELAVAEGDQVVAEINALLGVFRHAFATQDWHPAGHHSFASAHAGRAPYQKVVLPYGEQTLWPDHAVQGTPGAAIHPDIDQARIEVVIRKGFRREVDSYSAFFENDRTTTTGLDAWLRARGFQRVFLAGLATDFCVGWSAEDATRLGYAVVLIEDASRGIGLSLPEGGTTLAASRARLEGLGVRFATVAEVTRAAGAPA